MRRMRRSSYGSTRVVLISILGTIVSACTGHSGKPDGGPTSSADGDISTESDTATSDATTTGTTDDSSTSGDGDGDSCVPGVPASSQVPRMLNKQYDFVMRDLLNVTTLASNGGKAPSFTLSADSSGSLDGYGWNAYLKSAADIAAEVMAGANRSRFIECDPAAPDCFKTTVRAFGRKAFRRPLLEEEVDSFLRLATLEPAGTPEEIAEAILFAFLASPSFILLPELVQDKEGEFFKLSAHEVATRLSFLLWGSIPDQDLNEAADNGLLATADQILAQAIRMVGDSERVGSVMVDFHRYYADIVPGSHWGSIQHDPQVFLKYSPESQAPMMEEMDAFFEEIALNGSFGDLFLSPVAFLNQATAPLYGLEASSYGPALTRVELEASERPGFLTRAGFLSSFSGYSATSPILRGAYISQKVVGLKIDPPPPGAENAQAPELEYRTQREVVTALTTSDATCRKCHEMNINPPGFVMERFDAVGNIQVTDPLGGPIDGSADVRLGATLTKPITSPAELMREISMSEAAQRRYAEKWVSFATRRLPNATDACLVDELSLSLIQENYTIKALLTDLTQAESFRLRSMGN
jgi:hypothetical protein